MLSLGIIADSLLSGSTTSLTRIFCLPSLNMSRSLME